MAVEALFCCIGNPREEMPIRDEVIGQAGEISSNDATTRRPTLETSFWAALLQTRPPALKLGSANCRETRHTHAPKPLSLLSPALTCGRPTIAATLPNNFTSRRCPIFFFSLVSLSNPIPRQNSLQRFYLLCVGPKAVSATYHNRYVISLSTARVLSLTTVKCLLRLSIRG